MLRVFEFRAKVCVALFAFVDFSKLFTKKEMGVEKLAKNWGLRRYDEEMRYTINDGIM